MLNLRVNNLNLAHLLAQTATDLQGLVKMIHELTGWKPGQYADGQYVPDPCAGLELPVTLLAAAGVKAKMVRDGETSLDEFAEFYGLQGADDADAEGDDAAPDGDAPGYGRIEDDEADEIEAMLEAAKENVKRNRTARDRVRPPVGQQSVPGKPRRKAGQK